MVQYFLFLFQVQPFINTDLCIGQYIHVPSYYFETLLALLYVQLYHSDHKNYLMLRENAKWRQI